MPQARQRKIKEKTVEDVVAQLDLYPAEAFEFLQQGLRYSTERYHGPKVDPKVSRHISGQQLCEGLREFALERWGMLARTVLRHWNINATLDFGKMVFAMVENRLLQKTEEDTLDDFRDVYSFKTAFEGTYRIEPARTKKPGEVGA